MSRLSYLTVPLPDPPGDGQWALRWTRPDGSTFRSDDHPPAQRFDSIDDAEYWRVIAERGNPDGCRVDVVPARRDAAARARC